MKLVGFLAMLLGVLVIFASILMVKPARPIPAQVERVNGLIDSPRFGRAIVVPRGTKRGDLVVLTIYGGELSDEGAHPWYRGPAPEGFRAYYRCARSSHEMFPMWGPAPVDTKLSVLSAQSVCGPDHDNGYYHPKFFEEPSVGVDLDGQPARGSAR